MRILIMLLLLCTCTNTFAQSYIDNYITEQLTYKLISKTSDGLYFPVDLDFNPDTASPNELWVLSYGTEDLPTYGGSTVIYSNAGEFGQTAEYKQDENAYHFMNLPTAIAFGNNGTFATSTGVYSANHDGTTFTGPSLWSSDLTIYAEPSGGNGSHLDMIHQSPYSMGIAHENDNAYWVFDGYNSNIVRYDFSEDHGPGNDDHSDGKLKRYSEIVVKMVDDLPSHIVLDKVKGWLYIVDNGNKRVLRLNINSGNIKKSLTPQYEPLEEYYEMENAEWEIYIGSGLTQPCGIDYKEGRLIVSDYLNGDIIIYNTQDSLPKEIGRIKTGTKGIMGVKIAPNFKIWYVNNINEEVYRIDPETEPTAITKSENLPLDQVDIFPNPANNYIYVEGFKGEIPSFINIYDTNGRIVLAKEKLKSNEINVSKLNKGIYFLRVGFKDHLLSSKLIITQ